MNRSYARKVVGQVKQMKDGKGNSLDIRSLFEVASEYPPGSFVQTAGYELKVNEKSVCIQPRPLKLDKWRILKMKEEGWIIG